MADKRPALYLDGEDTNQWYLVSVTAAGMTPPIANTTYFDFLYGGDEQIYSKVEWSLGSGFTLTGWFLTSDPNQSIVYCDNILEDYSQPSISTNENGHLVFKVSGEVKGVSASPVNDSEWHYFMLRMSLDGSFSFNVDGKEASKGSVNFSNFGSSQLFIGNSDGGSFGGYITGIALYPEIVNIPPDIPTSTLYYQAEEPKLKVVVISPFHHLMQSPVPPFYSDTVKTSMLNLFTFEAIPGGTLIGGTGSITGTVKRKIGDLADVYSKATILLTDSTDGRIHRRLYPNPDGSFIIPNLQVGRGEFIVSVTDWFSDAYDVAMNVRVGDVLDMVLIDKDATTPQPTHKVEGHVTNHLDQPISRKVCVYSRVTNAMLGSAQSGVDGFYSIPFVPDGKVYVVCLPNPDEDVNAKIFDRVEPVPI